MASSSDADCLNLFASPRLEPLQKVQPDAEVLKCNEQPSVYGWWEASPITKFWRFLYTGKECGAHKAYIDDGDYPSNPCEHVIRRLILNGMGNSVISSLHKLSNESTDALCFGRSIAYSLAVCVCNGGETKQEALKLLSQICTYPIMLLQFAFYYVAINKEKKCACWTKPIKRSMRQWYCNKRSYDVAFGVSSCPSFQKLDHSCVLRSCHVKPGEQLDVQMLTAFIAQGFNKVEKEYGDQIRKSDNPEVKKLKELLDAITKVKRCNDSDDVSLLIAKHRLTWGHLPHALHKSEKIWQNALPGIPIDILITKLPDFHLLNLVDGGSDFTNLIVDRLKSEVKSSGLHPFRILWHKLAYESGKSRKQKKEWTPNNDVLGALDAAFLKSFANVLPTGKRICVTTDASKSMKGYIVKSRCLDCETVAAGMCLILAKTEKNCTVQAFSKEFKTIAISKDDTLKSVKEKIAAVPLGGTDCARPMIDAKRKKKKFDCFVIFTDSQIEPKGKVMKTKPAEALRQYRQKLGIAARLVVVALKAKEMRPAVADDGDRGMLDICGFGENTPSLINDFISEKF